MSLLRDEKHKLSTARCAFWLTLLVALALIALDAFGVTAVPQPAYAFLTAVVIGLMSWAGGGRVAQYLAPQLSAAASAIAGALSHGKTKTKTADEGPSDAA